MEFLKLLEIKTEKERENLRSITPATESLKNSLAMIGN